MLSPHAYVWLLAGWVVLCAALTTQIAGGDDDADVERMLGRRAAAPR